MTHAILVTVTFPNSKDARHIAKTLVEAKLAACAQLEDIQSFYAWAGELCNEPEVRMTLKTRDTLFDALKAAILKDHPYQVPEIVATPITNASPDYLEWLMEQTRAP